jgi:serine/threonine-protein phosphatase 2A regulatory subunit B'
MKFTNIFVVPSQVIRTLLRCWPVVNSSKEVLFISEIEELLSVCEPEQFPEVAVPLFQRIAKCLASPHFQVCEKALSLWNNEYVFSLIFDHSTKILPIIFGPLYYNSKYHWNKYVITNIFQPS